MSQVMREVDQVKGVMSENINQAMSNLESTEALNDKTQEMKAQSNMFNKQAKTAKNQMWWENAELNIIIVRVAVVIVGGRHRRGLLWGSCLLRPCVSSGNSCNYAATSCEADQNSPSSHCCACPHLPLHFCNRHSHADHDGVNAFRFCGGHPVSDSTRR